MDASASSVSPLGRSFEVPAWKSILNHLAAFVTAAIFLTSGVYKALDPYAFAKLAEQLKVHAEYSIPLAIGLATFETLAGVLVLVPRFRRWGGMLASLLLVSFIGYMAINYAAIQGQDCSCFPTINLPFGLTLDFKRSVGPGFFYGDAAMLVGALLATLWAKRSEGLRTAAVMLGAVAVFVGVSYGMAYGKHNSATAPDSITVSGAPLNLHQGKYFIFFFDPECSHCNDAAKTMGKLTWKPDMQVIGVATRQPQWAEEFMRDNKFAGKTSGDLEKLRKSFVFEGKGPYGVVLENGRQLGAVDHYEENGEPAVTLRNLGAIE